MIDNVLTIGRNKTVPKNSNTASYGYDDGSRLQSLSDGTNGAAYSYLDYSSLIGDIHYKHNGADVMTATRQYDKLNRLTNIAVSAGQTGVGAFGYGYNLANQRTNAVFLDGSRWAYQYDFLGQVTNASRYFSNGAPVAGQQFEYTFDDIGNRVSTRSGGDTNRANLRQAAYTVNSVNQYTQRTVPGWFDAMGTAASNTAVYAGGQLASRQGEYFRAEVPFNNSSAPVWTELSVVASQLTVGQTTNISTTNGWIWLSPTPETFTYDLDGNLTSDGRWTNTWDAENRLIQQQSRSDAPAGSKLRLQFQYDYQGRRIQKIVSTNNGATYLASVTNRFIYNGWNLVAVLDGANAIQQSFLWGSDLGGGLQSAGGVGGLIAMRIHTGPLAGTYFYCYDGNGNVTALVNAADGSVAAQYEYGPFGQLLRATGPLAFVNPFRFSTKYQDDETGLYYYGYRYYNPISGRFINRDPIEEDGGLNLYGFVVNDPIRRVDKLGLSCGCGPDVTQALYATLRQVQTVLNDDNNPDLVWNPNNPSETADDRRYKACSALFTSVPDVGSPASAWDIGPLNDMGRGFLKNKPSGFTDADLGNGDCARSVTFEGHCVWAGALNYTLFGVACKKCNEKFNNRPLKLTSPVSRDIRWSKEDMMSAVAWQKFGVYHHYFNNEAWAALDFAAYGYSGDSYWGDGPWHKCNISKKAFPDSPMIWKWSGMHK
jgi:RHS repeat-associated protein